MSAKVYSEVKGKKLLKSSFLLGNSISIGVGESIQIAADNGFQVSGDLFRGPVPPCDLYQLFDGVLFEPRADQSGGVSCYDAVWGKAFGNDGFSANNAPIAETDSRKYRCIISDPDVMSNPGILHCWLKVLFGFPGFPA